MISLKEKYETLVKQLEVVDQQAETLSRLEEELSALKKSQKESGSQNQVAVVETKVVTQNGLTKSQKSHLMKEVTFMKEEIQRLMKGNGMSQQQAEKLEAFKKDFSQETADFRSSVKSLLEEKKRLEYRVKILKTNMIPRPPQPPAPSGKTKAVIYDCDGLLVDSEPWWRQAEMELYATVGIKLTDEDCKATTGLRIKEITNMYYNKYKWDSKQTSREDLTKRIERRVAELIQTKAKLKPGVEESIKFFQTDPNYQGVKFAVCSSSSPVVVEAALGLMSAEVRANFRVVQSAENLPLAKPHPECYLRTAHALGVNPADCLVFEDSFPGCISALSAGMKVCAVPERESPKFGCANLVLKSLLDVPSTVASIC